MLAADEVIRSCSNTASPDSSYIKERGHPCEKVLRRMSRPDLLEYTAPVFSFDDVWKSELHGKHIDFLQVDIGLAGMPKVFTKGFAELLAKRGISILSVRIDKLWTKRDLKAVVELLDKFEYFALFKTTCIASSQVAAFTYTGPGGPETGPTTYLPLSGIDLEKHIKWNELPLPQDLIAFDLKQPDLFKTIQLGDEHCGADEDSVGQDTCRDKDASGTCRAADEAKAAGPPERPQHLRVVRSDSRSLTIEWHTHPDGVRPRTYTVRIDPGTYSTTLDHDAFDALTGVQLHTVTGLKPSTEYSLHVQAFASGGGSAVATVNHRTEHEEMPAAAEPYEVIESLHCGMGTSEEVQPAGPPPQGKSFYQNIVDADGCRNRCDDTRGCVAFQVKTGDACWLYRQRPPQNRMQDIRYRTEVGWFCGVRK